MGKKKKVQIMTDEEKAVFEEQQRLLEEEMRKKKEAVLTQFLKDKLMHEERATDYNLTKLNFEWRHIMRAEKAKELKKDIELLSQTFERVIDTKDAVMKTLVNEIIEAEEMYAMAVRSHLQVVDYLLGPILQDRQKKQNKDVQKERLDMITREYCQQLETICEEFDLERAMLIEHHHTEMHNIDDILFAIDELKDKDETQARMEYEYMEVEIKNKSLEDKQALRFQLGTKIEELWQQFRQMLQTYSETSEDKRSTYEALRQKDDKRSKDIEINMRKMTRLERQISQQRAKLSAHAWGISKTGTVMKDDEDDEEFNKAERMRLAHGFQQAKAGINQIRVRERERLVRLAVENHATIEELHKQTDKGISILKLAEICRKLETEEEKLVPFYVSSLTKEEEEDIMAAVMEPSSLFLVEAMHDCSGLEHFWKRYNKVLLDKLSLDKEKEILSVENQQLRRLLKQYMDSISVNDQVMRQNNPLLMVKSSVTSNRLAELKCCCLRQAPPKTVIEAAHVANKLLN